MNFNSFYFSLFVMYFLHNFDALRIVNLRKQNHDSLFSFYMEKHDVKYGNIALYSEFPQFLGYFRLYLQQNSPKPNLAPCFTIGIKHEFIMHTPIWRQTYCLHFRSKISNFDSSENNTIFYIIY